MAKGKIYLALEKADIELEKADKNKVLYIPKTAPEKSQGPTSRVAAQRERSSLPRSTNQPLHTVFASEFVAAEQFRKLRTHIIKIDSVRSTKTIMVTSSVPDEGKSFVATNLAIGFAQDFQLHCLLVDCDLRNPSLGPRFGVQQRRGISDFLMGQEDLSRFLIKTNLEKLSLLPSGSIQGNPAELMGSYQMSSLVKDLKGRYNDRFIIFDSTPLLVTSEAEILAKLVDGVIMVIRAGKTPRETVEHAVHLLGKDKVLGLVLNDVEFKSSGLFSRYFGSAGYYYGYGKDKKKSPESRGWLGLFRSKRKNS
jgi:exopolysaccharide/PEP-CTERM locus tyrosine autokinase